MESLFAGNGSDILLEADIVRLGRALHKQSAKNAPGLFQAAYWQGLLLDWTLRDPALKADLFRLVDTLPALSNSGQIARHARKYLLTGAGAKACGPGYLLNFAEMRVCTENTMRHGFTPETL